MSGETKKPSEEKYKGTAAPVSDILRAAREQRIKPMPSVHVLAGLESALRASDVGAIAKAGLVGTSMAADFGAIERAGSAAARMGANLGAIARAGSAATTLAINVDGDEGSLLLGFTTSVVNPKQRPNGNGPVNCMRPLYQEFAHSTSQY